ncbi:hypothetical protein J2X02_000688 [Pseudoxanthomonas japonensis]|uniref:hypothetical protein n=1 Tax=Pseudoxanthomonas japonensis TaxID=69284 RepID=UPI0028630FC0|nr:hypothetical protein [Pseudoxanthomonas japonensis]MDR7067871.1 hypothetical protein [Pseudoxanthomonas japonensis]
MVRNPRMLSLCGLWVATALMVAATMYVSLDARYYFFHDDAQRAVWEWAPAGPLTMLAIILLEAAVMAAVIALKRPGALWLRALLALLPMLPWAFVSSMYVVHAPGYVMLHILWCWLLVMVLALMLVVSAGADLWRRWSA